MLVICITGTPLSRALEDEDEVVRAAAAAFIPAHVILFPRSQAKVAADALEALKKLPGKPPWEGRCLHGMAQPALTYL